MKDDPIALLKGYDGDLSALLKEYDDQGLLDSPYINEWCYKEEGSDYEEVKAENE